MPALPRGERVRLRELTLADQGFLDRVNAHPGEFTAFDRPRKRPVAEKLAEGPLIGDHGGDAVVVRCADGEPIGVVDWRAAYYAPERAPFSRVWTIGRELLPDARGRGYGTEALRLLVGWLFTASDAHRIEIRNEPDNLAARRSAERAGMVAEGVLREAVYRAGAYRDIVVYGVTRPRWEAGS